ncbi:MAG TPA: hypothetical protein VGE98_04550 [Thermoanaerobaculia bacterium]
MRRLALLLLFAALAVRPPEVAAAGLALSGSVRTGDGAAVAGARIELGRIPDALSTARLELAVKRSLVSAPSPPRGPL